MVTNPITKTEKIEKRILWISFIAGVFFVIAELAMALQTRSQAVLFDATYDASELIIIGLTLFLTPLFYKPISEKHPFGFAQVESVFIIIKAFMMIAVTIGLSVNNIEIALSGGNQVDGMQISLFQLIAGLVSLVILIVLIRINRTISSPIAKAEIYGWKMDVFYGLGLSLAFFVSTFLQNTPLAPIVPYFDQIIATLIVFFMLPTLFKMIFSSIRDVFLFAPEKNIMDNVKQISNAILNEFNFESTFFDVTRTGRKLWIAIYFKVQGTMLNMADLQQATLKINTELIKIYEDCEADLIADP